MSHPSLPLHLLHPSTTSPLTTALSPPFQLSHHQHPILAGASCAHVTSTPPHNKILPLSPTSTIRLTALHTPCHTQDSICWAFHDERTGERAVFTGDTLFHGGCGRFFEGTAEEMNTALNEVLARLEGGTRVFVSPFSFLALELSMFSFEDTPSFQFLPSPPYTQRGGVTLPRPSIIRKPTQRPFSLISGPAFPRPPKSSPATNTPPATPPSRSPSCPTTGV